MIFENVEESYDLTEELKPNDLIPVGAQIEIYYNASGVDSGASNGYSDYYIVDKELTLNTLVMIIDAKGCLKISSGQISILKNSDEDEDEYQNLTETFNY